MRRMCGALVACSVLVGAVVAGGPAGADPQALVLHPSTPSVAVGGTLRVTAPGCPGLTGPEGERAEQHVAVSLVNGVGRRARVASADDGTGLVTVPGWVDPSQPTVLRGACVRYHFGSGEVRGEVVLRYPDFPLEVTPLPAGTPSPITPVARPLRSSAASGQTVRVLVSGCAVGDVAYVVLFAGEIDGVSPTPPVASAVAQQTSRSPFVVEVPLLSRPYLVQPDPDDPDDEVYDRPAFLADGTYSVVAVCSHEDPDREDGGSQWLSAAQPMRIAGTRPSDAIATNAGVTSRSVVVSGQGCTGGQQVVATIRGARGIDVERDRSASPLQRAADRDPQPFLDVVRATPDPTGDWALTWTGPADGYDASATVDCGRPDGAGFRYLTPILAARSATADLWVSRVSPTSARTDDTITVRLLGRCSTTPAVELLDDQGRSVTTVAAVGDLRQEGAAASFPAPGVAGSYEVRGRCGGEFGPSSGFDVAAAVSLADPSPLPAEPTEGWPAAGPRDVFHGRLGPIVLPAAMDGGGHEHDAARMSTTGPSTTMLAAPVQPEGLGSSGYGVSVPRPAGDFAITAMHFAIVDEHGRKLGQQDVHLHHFVVGDLTETNPACPDGTFGLPGRPVVAAGAELTPIDFGAGPYGLVVDRDDQWAGVYQLMNRTAKDRTVYLSYDLEIRRDVANVRPVTPYFGSAAGCRSSSWSIDGSGRPDEQATYLTIAEDGVLIGAGAHLHNGARDAVLRDDRGRVLCRSVPRFGTRPIGHGADPMAPLLPDEEGYTPRPEFYRDDPELIGVSTCAVHERVRAGEQLRFETTYTNDRVRSGVMGITSFYVWEGGGPAAPA